MAETLVKRNANLNDTINLIVTVVNQCYNSEFVKQLTSTLNPQGDKVEFMHRLFDYVCRNVNYKLDPDGRERVLKPETTIANGEGDCKKMTVLIASVLKQAGINCLIKHVYYEKENYTHVYVIVPYPDFTNYITVDPVNDKKWNSEVDYYRGNVYDLNGNKMDLYTGNKPRSNFSTTNFRSNVNNAAGSIEYDMMRTMGCNVMGAIDRNKIIDEIFEMSGMGKKKLKDRLKDLKEKVKEVSAAVGLAPGRIAFLGILKLNPAHIANKIAAAATVNRAEVENQWRKLGGKPDELFKVVLAAANKTSGMGFVVDAALLAAAAPVMIAMISMVKKVTGKEDPELDSVLDKTADSHEKTPNRNIVVTSHDVVKRNDSDKDDSGDDDGTKPSITGFDIKQLLQPFNLFKFAFIYFPAGMFALKTIPVIFISVCVIGIADAAGLLPKFLRSPKKI